MKKTKEEYRMSLWTKAYVAHLEKPMAYSCESIDRANAALKAFDQTFKEEISKELKQ